MHLNSFQQMNKEQKLLDFDYLSKTQSQTCIYQQQEEANNSNDKSYVFLKNSIKNIVGMFTQFKQDILGQQYLDHILGVKTLVSVPKKIKIQGVKKVKKQTYYGEFIEEYNVLFSRQRQKRLRYNTELVIEIGNTNILRRVVIYFLDRVADYWLMCRSKVKEQNKFPYRNAIRIFKQALFQREKPKFKQLSNPCQYEDPQIPEQLKQIYGGKQKRKSTVAKNKKEEKRVRQQKMKKKQIYHRCALRQQEEQIQKEEVFLCEQTNEEVQMSPVSIEKKQEQPYNLDQIVRLPIIYELSKIDIKDLQIRLIQSDEEQTTDLFELLSQNYQCHTELLLC